MTHQSTEPGSAQGTNNSISKLIIAPETGNANKALQPGTPFLLQGCMCQEGDGVIVVKVNWRDKTYTGSLMDMEQYPWATPKHVEIAELGSPLEKKHRFGPRLQFNQTKHNVTNQEVDEHHTKENDVAMSPQSSDLVESEEGRSPDPAKPVLPKLINCTELNKTNLMASFMDIDRGFRSKQTLGLLSSPSNSLTDLKAEGEKKKTHELHAGITHPKEVIQNILGDGNVLPFDKSSRERAKLGIDIKEEMRDDLISRPMLPTSTKRTPDPLLSKQIDQPKKEGFAPARPTMPHLSNPFSMLPQHNSIVHPDTKQKLAYPIKPVAEKQVSGQEYFHKSEPVSPKSSTPDSPNDSKQQKKRKSENNHDNSLPKRPDTLVINTPEHLSYHTQQDKIPLRVDDTSNIRAHVPINKSSSAPHQPHPSSPSIHTPKPHPDRKPYIPTDYNTGTDILGNVHKFSRDNGKERQDNHNIYAQPQTQSHGFVPSRPDKSRNEKKPKRPREGGSPADHSMDVSKANHPTFIPAPSDSKMAHLTTPNIKIEAQPHASYLTPDMLSYYLSPLYLQSAGLPVLPFADQQKILQATFQEAKVVETEKAKQKTGNTHKSKSQKVQQQQQHVDLSHLQRTFPINPQLLAQNPIALMMNPQNLPLSMISKESAVASGLAMPGFPVMLEPDKEKVRQTLSQPFKQKVTTPSSASANTNSTRRPVDKSSNHDTQEERTQNSFQHQEYIKQMNAQHHLLKLPDNIEHNQSSLNLTPTFKHKSSATTGNNNRITNQNPPLTVISSNQAKNGLFPYPYIVTPDLQQMIPNIPFPPLDPSLHLPMPYYDPIAMRYPPIVQAQPDTLDSK